jgi:hypothetical protein
MFLMDRLVSRSARSLAVMLGAATSGRERGRDDLRVGRNFLATDPVRPAPFLQYPGSPQSP